MATRSKDWYVLRSRAGVLSRQRPADDPELIEAKAAFAQQVAIEKVRLALSEAPPLTEAQRADLAALVAGGAR